MLEFSSLLDLLSSLEVCLLNNNTRKWYKPEEFTHRGVTRLRLNSNALQAQTNPQETWQQDELI
jgi:hypothetical protein